MAKWIRVVESNCTDAAREAEFHEWYNKVHLPDMLETPDIIRATRYEAVEPSEGEARFLAVYEIETDDIDKLMKVSHDNIARKRTEGRMSDLIASVSHRNYKQISSLSK
jgi:hypothetical protein